MFLFWLYFVHFNASLLVLDVLLLCPLTRNDQENLIVVLSDNLSFPMTLVFKIITLVGEMDALLRVSLSNRQLLFVFF